MRRSGRVYELETFVDRAIINYEPHYLCQWKGLGHEHDTWEPVSELWPVREYLQYWTNKWNIDKDSKKDQKKLRSVKKYLHGDQPAPRSTSRHQKMAEEFLKTKSNLWEKYLQKNDEYLGLTDKKAIPPKRQTRARQDHAKVEASRKRVQRAERRQKYAQEEKQGFRVTGQIDMDDILEITRAFVYSDTRCLEVLMRNGKRTNMKESDVRKYQPMLFLEFCQSTGMPV